MLYSTSWCDLNHMTLFCHKLCDWICKEVLYTFNFLTSRIIYNLACVWPTALKFRTTTFTNMREIFGLIASPQINLWFLKVAKIRCVYKISSVTYRVKHHKLVNTHTEFFKNDLILDVTFQNSRFQNSNSDSTEDYSWFLELLMWLGTVKKACYTSL